MIRIIKPTIEDMICYNIKLYTVTAFIILAAAMGSRADNATSDVIAKPLTGGAWELRMQGVTDENKLQSLRRAASMRPVRIAVVGLGGVSRTKLAVALTDGNTLEYCNGVGDLGIRVVKGLNQTLLEDGRIISAKFKVKFTDSKMARMVTVKAGNQAEFKYDDDGRRIEQWLVARGFKHEQH